MINKEKLLNIMSYEYEKIFNNWFTELQSTQYKNGYDISYLSDKGAINIFIIRMNKLGVMNDQKRNNDYMVMVYNAYDGIEKYVFDVTADPKTKRGGIASILPQVYKGNIRNHRWIFGRTAVCQDNHPVWVWRYGTNVTEKGFFGINIHDNGGAWNSSLGCTILADSDSYKENFKRVLDIVKKGEFANNIPVAVFEEKDFEKHLSII